MSQLDSFQREILGAFFEREHRFYLTGGAALAGFHLRHRSTQDLDLFTLDDEIDEGTAVLGAVARDLGASVERLQTYPDFRRLLIRRGAESVVIDLVRERTPQVGAKLEIDGIRVDAPEEILANKLCTLLSRAEIRDLIDVQALEGAGLRVEDHLDAAARKDGGVTAGQLSWVLSQIRIGDDARLPSGFVVEKLRAYLHELVERLADQSFPVDMR